MTDEDQIQNLQFTVLCYETGEPIAITPRLDRFARHWARRWLRLYGSLPRLDHPFPNGWDTKFIIDYGSSRAQTGDNPASAHS
jgi:hypothetical protein